MKFLQILEAILGVGAQVSTIFIHNPKSQQIEAVVLSDAEGILQMMSQVNVPVPAAPPSEQPAAPAAV